MKIAAGYFYLEKFGKSFARVLQVIDEPLFVALVTNICDVTDCKQITKKCRPRVMT